MIVLYSEQQLLASSFNVLSSLHPNSLVGGGEGGGGQERILSHRIWVAKEDVMDIFSETALSEMVFSKR